MRLTSSLHKVITCLKAALSSNVFVFGEEVMLATRQRAFQLWLSIYRFHLLIKGCCVGSTLLTKQGKFEGCVLPNIQRRETSLSL